MRTRAINCYLNSQLGEANRLARNVNFGTRFCPGALHIPEFIRPRLSFPLPQKIRLVFLAVPLVNIM